MIGDSPLTDTPWRRLDGLQIALGAAFPLAGADVERAIGALTFATELINKLGDAPAMRMGTWLKIRPGVEALETLLTEITANEDVPHKRQPALRAAISDATDRLLGGLEEALASVRQDRRVDRTLASALTNSFRSQLAAGEATSARDAAVEALETVRAAAGATSETVLGQAFREYGERQNRVADRLRAGTIILVAAITAFVGFLAFAEDVGVVQAASSAGRLALVLPPTALAAYLGRESARHRAAAAWAAVLEVQLRSIDAYCQTLADDELERLALRAAFGRRVFLSEGPSPPDLKGTAPSTAGDAGDMLGQALELVRALGGRGNGKASGPA